jgi:hypothetical protein
MSRTPKAVQDPPASLREALRAGLSLGWRLGGTLGIGSKKHVPLKERKNPSNAGQ